MLNDAQRLEFQQAINRMIVVRDKMMQGDDYDSVIVRLQGANAVFTRLLKPDSGTIIDCSLCITMAYWFKRDWENAKMHCIATTGMMQRTLGEGDPEYVNQLGILGDILTANGELDKAEPLLRRAAKDFERLGGSDYQPFVAQNLSRLGKVLYKANKLAEAEATFQDAIRRSEKDDMSTDRATVYSLRGLADIYSDQGKYSDAEESLRRALELDEKTFGKLHLEVAADLDCYAKLFRKQNRTEDADRMDARAKEVRDRLDENRREQRQRHSTPFCSNGKTKGETHVTRERRALVQ